jgi:hypothetical protein
VSSWHSYPSIYNLGHRAVRDLLTVPHYVEEKVDGSQFSFGLFEAEDAMTGPSHELRIRSKGAVMITDAPEKMFSLAAESVNERQHLLHPGWTYRAEYLRTPKHNTLAYDRVPKGNLILFDVSTGEEEYLGPEEKRVEAERIGLECVPMLYITEDGSTLERFREIIDNTVSVLGGQKIEGIVVKQLGPDYLYGQDKKALIGKFVSERFKEAHVGAWKESNPGSGDILLQLGKKYCTQARWMKAVQHLREAGTLTDSPKDIGPLMIEIQKDMGKEEKEAIQRDLWRWAYPHITRAATRGFPEFYKMELLRRQFEHDGGEMVLENGSTITFAGSGDEGTGRNPVSPVIVVSDPVREVGAGEV